MVGYCEGNVDSGGYGCGIELKVWWGIAGVAETAAPTGVAGNSRGGGVLRG